MWFEHGNANPMNRCANQRPSIVTEFSACSLILLTVSGCAMIQDMQTLTKLIQAGTVSADPLADERHNRVVDDRPTRQEHMDSDEPQTASSFEEKTAPAARLLNPDFGDSGTSQTDSADGGHSISTYASPKTGSTGPLSIRQVSDALGLFERSTNRTLAAADHRSGELFEPTIGPAAKHPSANQDSDGRSAVTERVNTPSVTDEYPKDPGRPLKSQQPSVLDRIRNLAPERSPRQLVRQLERFPNPLQWDKWGDIFGSRGDSEPPSLPTPNMTAQQIPASPAQIIASAKNSGDLLEALIKTLENEVSTWPQADGGSPLQPDEFRRRQLNLRLLQLIADRPAAAAEAVDSMTSEEKTFWQELILAISRFRNPDEDVDYSDHVAATIGQFRTAVRHLETLSSLSIGRLDFCSRIYGFGSIEPFLTNTFEPGKRLLIYAEVENLKVEISPLGIDKYRTSFGGTLQIWSTSSDEEIGNWDLPTIHDDSSTLRSDYFLSYDLTLPPHLHEGDYEIRLQIRDDISGRTVDATLDFSVQ